MALGFFNRLAGDRPIGYSAGSEAADQINQSAVAVMAEVGIDITAQQPQRWTHNVVEEADVVVTMGCGDTCPFVPGRRYVDRPLADPAGRPVEAVRPIRDEIESHDRQLLAELGVLWPLVSVVPVDRVVEYSRRGRAAAIPLSSGNSS